ncbi:MFS transporter [Leucobacter sp. GX24907]
MTTRFDRKAVRHWATATLIVFTMIGFGFGTWLSRLPAVRDELGATTQEMSYLVLTLAVGTLAGLLLSGRLVGRIGPRRSIAAGVAVQFVALPGAVALILTAPIYAGIAALFLYGLSFAVSEVAVNVNGAGAERAIGKARMPLFHAGFSLGTVSAMGIGALAETFKIPLQLHFLGSFLIIAVATFAVLRFMPHHPQQSADQARAIAAGEADAAAETATDTAELSNLDSSASEGPVVDGSAGGGSAGNSSAEVDAAGSDSAGDDSAAEDAVDDDADDSGSFDAEPLTLTGSIPIIDSAAGQQPAFSTMTGTIPIITPEHFEHADASADGADGSDGGSAPPTKHGSAWRDPRVVLIALIALSVTFIDGTAADWLPLALVDERGISNEAGATLLGVFFASVLLARVLGSALIDRVGRVAVVQGSAVVCSLGVISVILVPSWAGMVLGSIAWGLGTALAWPIAISAAADRPETAARDVAAVSALGYGAMMVGPILIGFLGERLGLLTAFWALIFFAALNAVLAPAAREPWRPKRSRRGH